jgi:plasmid maintenance system killer protein
VENLESPQGSLRCDKEACIAVENIALRAQSPSQKNRLALLCCWLETLRGTRAGQFSIRVNDQFRLCFRWTAAGPEDVEIVDYH